MKQRADARTYVITHNAVAIGSFGTQSREHHGILQQKEGRFGIVFTFVHVMFQYYLISLMLRLYSLVIGIITLQFVHLKNDFDFPVLTSENT